LALPGKGIPKSSDKGGVGTSGINTGGHQKIFTRLVKLHFQLNAEAAVGKFIPKVPKNQFYPIFLENSG